jgi:hypothetical protein
MASSELTSRFKGHGRTGEVPHLDLKLLPRRTRRHPRSVSLPPCLALPSLTPITVYDVSSRASFTALTSWFRELSTYTSPEVVKIIVGNKVDKETFSREVTTKEGEEYARRMGCLFLECSAKANLGVEEAFKELVARVRPLALVRFVQEVGLTWM